MPVSARPYLTPATPGTSYFLPFLSFIYLLDFLAPHCQARAGSIVALSVLMHITTGMAASQAEVTTDRGDRAV